jgi:N-sulfoglucosamine sulfohydrolase
MRTLLAVLLALAAFTLNTRPAAADAPRRNVVLLIADDLGRELGCLGNTVIRTPHIDGLAKRGVLFPHAYANVSSCSPSRSVIYTGLHTHTSGQYGLAHADHNQHTRDFVQSLPRLLRNAGYWTGIIGKVHVIPGSIYPWEKEITGKPLRGNRDVVAMARAAREFIAGSGKRPFFLVMGYSDPHRAAKGFANNLFPKDPAEVRYDPAKIPVPWFLPDNPDTRKDLAEYYQSVSRLDRGIGLLLDVLRESGQLDNTLIIFLSDNGIPFPGAKTTLYEPGINLPLIVSSPAQKRRGGTSQALVSYVDVTPTILDWAGARGPSYKLPGRSVLSILDEENPKGWDQVFGSHQFHEITMYYPMRSLRTRTHKYILNLAHRLEYPLASDLWGSLTWQAVLRDDLKMLGERSRQAFLHRPPEELYDLTKDPHELHNLAGDPAHAAVLAELRGRVRAWQAATDDPWTILYRDEKRK